MLKKLLRFFCDWYGIGWPKLVCTLLFSIAAALMLGALMCSVVV